jgi:hypothetical protein
MITPLNWPHKMADVTRTNNSNKRDIPQWLGPGWDPTLSYRCWGYFLGQLGSWAISGTHQVMPETSCNPFTFTYQGHVVHSPIMSSSPEEAQPTSSPDVMQHEATDEDTTRVYHLNSHKASTVYFNASITNFKLHCTH